MNRTVGLVTLVIGIVLLVYGLNASESFTSTLSKIFNGTPSSKSIALLAIGGLLTVLGGASFFGDRSK